MKKQFIAIISTSSSGITSKIVKNEISSISFNVLSSGQYAAVSSTDVFLNDDTHVTTVELKKSTTKALNPDDWSVGAKRDSDTACSFSAWDNIAEQFSDDILENTELVITVYWL